MLSAQRIRLYIDRHMNVLVGFVLLEGLGGSMN